MNALGYLRVMFAVEDLDDTLARLQKHGAQLVGEVVRYEDVYRLCYIRGPEGLLIEGMAGFSVSLGLKRRMEARQGVSSIHVSSGGQLIRTGTALNPIPMLT